MINSFKDTLLLLRNKKRFPNAKIKSSSIDGSTKIGDNSSIAKGSSIYQKSVIGKNCVITSNVIIGKGVVLGDFSYVNSDTIIKSAKIGKFCSISYGCKIGMSEHPVNYISTSPYTYGNSNIFCNEPLFNEYFSPPIIENDVLLGANVAVLQGVTIGNGSIVAAGAVVTKDVPPYTIVGGVPAKQIKKRFSDEKADYLMKLKWWDLPHEELIKLKDTFILKEDWFNNYSS